jgi:hypothetical protein
MSGKNNQEAAAGVPMTTSWLTDIATGASLGILLGVLVGLSASPIVSGVAGGLVALLAGLFGLAEKAGRGFTSTGARRMVAFGLFAVMATPVGILARTHEWFAPSVAWQRASLTEIGISDPKEQNEMLRFLRFGILPKDASAAPKDSAAANVVSAQQPVLYSTPAEFCDAFMQLTSAQDRLGLMGRTNGTRDIANAIRNLPDDQQDAALNAGKIYLCKVH